MYVRHLQANVDGGQCILHGHLILGALVHWNTERNKGERSAEIRRPVCTGLMSLHIDFWPSPPPVSAKSAKLYAKYTIYAKYAILHEGLMSLADFA